MSPQDSGRATPQDHCFKWRILLATCTAWLGIWFSADAATVSNGNDEPVLPVITVAAAAPKAGEPTNEQLNTARAKHTATLLPNGKILVVGGRNSSGSAGSEFISTTELYDPDTGTWRLTGAMGAARQDHTATLLPDGKVLVTGGYGSSGFRSDAELYDPATGIWTPTGSMQATRWGHTATLLPNGKVLVTGGLNSVSSAELYDPATGIWTSTGSMNGVRGDHVAELLPDGKVLVAGGLAANSSLSSAELYDPATGTWTPTGGMITTRESFGAALLSSGKVMVTGGYSRASGGGLSSAELYDPGTATWTAIAGMNALRAYHRVTAMPDGKVLVAGGWSFGLGAHYLSSAETYDPATGTWTPTGAMRAARGYYTSTVLPNGQVLVASGSAGLSYVSGSERWNPATGTWLTTGTFLFTRIGSANTPLTVNFTVGGMATSGSDYVPVGSTVTFASSAVTANVSVSVIDDGLLEGDESVVLTLAAGSGYSIGSPMAATVTIADDDTTVSVVATDKTAGESATGGGNGTFTFTRTGSTSQALTVSFTTGGTATKDVDYTLAVTSMTFAPGEASTNLTVVVLDDTLVEGVETVLLTLSAGADYSVGSPSEATVTISDDDAAVPVIMLAATVPMTGEPGNGPLANARELHSTTLLPNGKVLIAGGYGPAGYLYSAELYDPATGLWSLTGRMTAARGEQTATLLPGGKVLVTGGYGSQSSAELYDPTTGTWTPTGTMRAPRASHTATLLPNGKVLVAGGYGYLASAELYDPATGTWTLTGSMNVARGYNTATLLPNGRVLVTGGFGANGALSSAELYNPDTGSWTTTSSMNAWRDRHAATLLLNGKVLVTGSGDVNSSLFTAELYDPATETWSQTGRMIVRRNSHTATLLPGGNVLVAGGYDINGRLSSAETYDPLTAAWSPAGALNLKRSFHTASLLPSGKVVVAGGWDDGILSTTELYDPGTGIWTATGTFNFTRSGSTTSSLSVNFTVGGTASNGVDYATLPARVTFAPGATITNLTLRVLDDALAEGDETVELTLGLGAGYTIGSASAATVRIQDDEVVAGNVSVVAADATAGEPGTGQGNGTFILTRTGSTISALTVNCAVSGTASSGTDYAPLSMNVTFAPGTTTTNLTVSVLDDALSEGGETVVLTLTSGSGYSLGSPASATVTIADDEAQLPVITVMATAPRTGEPPNGPLNLARLGHTATLLTNGKVLVAGGDASAELYDPSTRLWSFTGGMTLQRSHHTMTLLANGKVLVAGDSSAELYDPVTGLWSSSGSMTAVRANHTATLLPNGKVLVAGGYFSASDNTASAELYDPATESWFSTGSMSTRRANHTATLLPNGKVLVAGGVATSAYLSSSELYDPATGLWSPTGRMVGGRVEHTATLLPNGRVLVAAGFGPGSSSGLLASAELYDSATGLWSSTGNMITARAFGQTATALPNGKVLIAGGQTNRNGYLACIELAELYDPATGLWSATSGMSTERARHTATLLPNGKVLLAGGQRTPSEYHSSAELYNPASGTWDSPGIFAISRTGSTTWPLTVNFTVGGAATRGTDYVGLGTSVTLGSTMTDATVIVIVSDDAVVENDESVVLTLVGGSGYTVGSPSSATVTIADDDVAVSVVATDATAGEPGTGQGAGTFTFTRSGLTDSALTVNYLLEGTAINGTDYTLSATSITFAPGATGTNLTVSVVDDALAEGNETVVLTLANGVGYTVGSFPSATVTILDDEPFVSVGATDATAGEPGRGQGNGIFTFTRNGSTASALTVNFIVAGTATAGVDYAALGASVTFAPGATSTNLTVSVLDDSLGEADETVVLTLAGSPNYSIGSPASATVTIVDDDTSVSVTATDATAGEPGSRQSHGAFTFTRSSSSSSALTVHFFVGGTAISGLDYQALGTSVTFAPGTASTNLMVRTLEDGLVEGDETVELTLANGNGYTIGSPSSATVTIRETDATVSVIATDATAGEPGTGLGNGTFTFSRTGSTLFALAVNYSVNGTASNGSDCLPLIPVLFEAGSNTTTLIVSVLDDNFVEADETVVVTIENSGAYLLGGSTSATLTVQDDDAAVSVVASDAVAGEPGTGEGSGMFTFTRNGFTESPLTVKFALAGTAGIGTDYTSLGTKVTFAPGVTITNLTLGVVNDALAEGDETVILTLLPGTGYTIVSPSTASVTILDREIAAATVSVVANDATAGEPGTGYGDGIFTLSRSGSTSAPLTIGFVLGGTATRGTDYASLATSITFAAGATTTNLTVNVLDDTLAEEIETVVLTLASGVDYLIGASPFATVIIAGSQPIPCSSAPPGIIAWWPGDSGGADFASNNPAYLSNSVNVVTGKVGNALQFDGTNDFVLIPDASVLNFAAGQDFTLEAWIKPEAVISSYGFTTILEKNLSVSAVAGRGYALFLSEGHLGFRMGDGLSASPPKFVAPGPDLRDGNFHHVAVIVDRDSTTGGILMVDGSLVMIFDPTGQAGDLSNFAPLVLARPSDAPFSVYFKGVLDEVSLYDRVLLPGEVDDIYRAGSGGKCKPELPLAPIITLQPASLLVGTGSNATLRVSAAGSEPLAYQWSHNGTNLANIDRISGATDSVLMISSVQPGDAGVYSVIVSNYAGSVISSNLTLTVASPVVITSQPSSRMGVAGNTTILNVGATGTAPLFYQWRFAGTNLVSDGRIIGANGSLLTIFNTQPADAGLYSVVVSNAVSSVTSSNASLTVNLPVVITTQPGSATFPGGTTAVLSVGASGSAPLYYQWRFAGTNLLNGERISGATSSILIISNVLTGDAGLYSVVVSNAVNSVASSSALLAVNLPVAITSQPVSTSVAAGNTVILSVGASGAPLFYQWRRAGTNLTNGGRINGATSSQLVLSDVQPGDAGAYSVIVSNAVSSATSGNTLVTVRSPVTITSQPGSASFPIGTTAVLGIGASGTAPLFYQWRFGGTNLVNGGRISGADRSFLVISNAQPSDAGIYSVVVSNSVNSVTSSNVTLAVVSPSTVDAFNPGVNGVVYCTVAQADGKIVVGGNFSTLGNQARSYIGRLNADGTLDTSFNPGANSFVDSLAVQPDGKILVGGNFTSLSGQARPYLGRLNGDGTVDTSFNAGANQRIQSLTVLSDGKILASGFFTTLGGRTRPYLGRLNGDGTLDNGFNPQIGSSVSSHAVQPDGKVLVGGGIFMLGGQNRNFIGRLNADGTLDTGFNPEANSDVSNLAVQADGKIVVAGYFSALGGQSRAHIGRLNADGTVDDQFNPSIINLVWALAVQADGKILVGGDFTALSGQSRDYLGRINADGTLDTSFNPRANGYVWSLAVQADGKILVGGDFSTLAGQSRSRVGRLTPTEPATQVLRFDGSTINWQRGGSSPEVSWTYFEGATNGSNWIPLGAGTRVPGGWQLSGLSWPTNASFRARGFVAGGHNNGSGAIVETTIGPSVLWPATISSQPVSTAVAIGNTATFSVGANGVAPLAYQWRVNGTNLVSGGRISGATSSQLTISNTQPSDAGAYTVVVSNSLNTVTSSNAGLTVISPVVITSQAVSKTVVAGSTATLSVSANGGMPLFFQWRFAGTNLANGGRISGATSSQLTISNIQTGDAGFYYVVVSNAASSVTSTGALLQVTLPPVFISQAASTSTTISNTAVFSVIANGTFPLGYQWRVNGTNLANGGRISGATSSQLLISNVRPIDAGAYSVVVSNIAGSVTSSNATLIVVFPPAAIRVVTTTANSGSLVTVPITLTGNGNENALSFTLSLGSQVSPPLLTFDSVELGDDSAGALLLVNTNQLQVSGRIGIALALPAGTTFPAGTREVVRLRFNARLFTSPGNQNIALSFLSSPTLQQLTGSAGETLAASYSGGSVTLTPSDVEGDALPRITGNRVVDLTDWVQIGRFVANLDPLPPGKEFQRVDCAPRDTTGDGRVAVSDWVQAGRYAFGLDPLTAAGGPTNALPVIGAAADAGVHATSADRQLRAINLSAHPGQIVSVPVVLESQGNENALSFSLSFDPAIFTYLGLTSGTNGFGVSTNVNTSQLEAGRLGVVAGLNIGTTFPAGTRELFEVKLQILPSSAPGSYPINLGDLPVSRGICDANATDLNGRYNAASVIIALPKLEIAKLSDSIRLAWPDTASDFMLQTLNPESLSGVGWTNVAGSLDTNQSMISITLPLSEQAAFYRLNKP